MTATLTPAEVEHVLRDLPQHGMKVYDFRGKSPSQKDTMLATIKSDIDLMLSSHGMAQDHPITFVAGSGKTNDQSVLKEARSMGDTLEIIVNGGSQYSVMGEIANGAKISIGVTCDAVLPFETPDSRYSMLIIADGPGTEGLEHRLEIMRTLSNKELAMHGGVGTAEEFLGGIPKRSDIAMLTPFWEPMLETFKKMFKAGYIDRKTIDKIHPVSASGTPIENLSHGIEPNETPDFRNNISSISSYTKTLLETRESKKAHIISDIPISDKVMKESDFFILPPGNIESLHQAALIMLEKRFDKKYADGKTGKASYPGILKKPLVLLNVDGFYDEFMAQWQQMSKGGYLLETLGELITEVKISSHATQQEIQEAINAKVPNEIGAAMVRSSFRSGNTAISK